MKDKAMTPEEVLEETTEEKLNPMLIRDVYCHFARCFRGLVLWFKENTWDPVHGLELLAHQANTTIGLTSRLSALEGEFAQHTDKVGGHAYKIAKLQDAANLQADVIEELKTGSADTGAGMVRDRDHVVNLEDRVSDLEKLTKNQNRGREKRPPIGHRVEFLDTSLFSDKMSKALGVKNIKDLERLYKQLELDRRRKLETGRLVKVCTPFGNIEVTMAQPALHDWVVIDARATKP